jgi:hypothetical protein
MNQIVQEAGDWLMECHDFEVLAGQLAWHRIDINRLQDNRHAVDIAYWLTENCTGDYHRTGRYFLFASQTDAVLFQLRWT